MSKKAQKRLNRLLRMSGRTLRDANNALQHLASKRFARDVARTLRDANNALQHLASKRFARDVAQGGEQQLVDEARRMIDLAKAEQAARQADLERIQREVGVWG